MKAQENPRILVIEDEPETAEMLKQLLEVRSSAEVETVGTLADARERLSSGSFDMVTVDYRLPDGYGLDILGVEDRPPVIVVTGHGDEDVAARAFSRGAAGYIVKNERLAVALPEAVEKALRQFVLMRAVEAVRESESFYHSLFEESSDALFIETADGTIEELNRAASVMLGLPRDQIVGRRASEFVPAGRKEEFHDTVTALVAGQVVEFENVRSDGTVIPVEVAAREVMTRHGTRYLVSARDVSERRRAEKALRNERMFIEEALDALPDVFTVADLDGSFYKWNRSFREITGYSDDEIASMRTSDFMGPGDFERVISTVRSVVEAGQPSSTQVAIVTRDGRVLPYEFTGSLIRDSEGNPLGVAGIGRDMSERKRSEEALRSVIRETNERREEITALLQSTRLVLEHREFEDAAREIFNLCWRLVGSEAGYVALFDEESVSRMLFFAPEEMNPGVLPPVRMPVERLKSPAFTSGKAFYENDFAESEWAPLVPAEHLRVDNLLVAPLVVKGESAGILAFANKPGGFTGRDALMASAFGEVASVALSESIATQKLQDSEERFRSVAETAIDAIILGDAKANITFWNASAEKMFGYTEREVLGRGMTVILPEREREARLESMLEHSALGETGGKTFETTGMRKDGSEFPVEFSRSSWSSGGKLSFAVIARDVTERKVAEEELRESEELHRSLLRLSPDAITVFDTGAHLLATSRRAADVYGFYESEQLAAMTALDFASGLDRERMAADIERVLDGHMLTDVEYEMLHADGGTFIGEVNAAPLFDRQGLAVGFMSITRDVTQRRKAEHDLQVLNSELEGYAHLVSHDLKGPLASINAASVAMRGLVKEELSEQAVSNVIELAHIIENNVRKSIDLTDGLLDLAEAGHLPWEVSEVDIGQVVRRVVEERAGANVTIEADEDLGRVRANATHMYMLFANLISNAIKHNDKSNPEVRVSYSPRGGGVHDYTVCDNGPGIDPAKLDKIFLPFFSGVTGRPGIGLATVDKIVNIYGGEVRVRNDDGACFDFTLKDYRAV